MNTPDQSESKNDLRAVFEKIQEIAVKSDDGDYIYRGEPKRYQKVSSSLWRECSKTLDTDQFDIKVIQDQKLKNVNSPIFYGSTAKSNPPACTPSRVFNTSKKTCNEKSDQV